MSQCPNSDPEFNKIIGEQTPETRSNLFLVCVFVRTILYTLVYLYKDHTATPFIVGLASIFSIFQLSKPTDDRQWWSKKFQITMSILILISSDYFLFSNIMISFY
jgi:hypothetical protein